MLLNSFFRMSGSVRATGCVVFESSTPGTYTYNFPKQKRKIITECVGGATAGFSAKLGFYAYGQGPYTGLVAISGTSGGYTTKNTSSSTDSFKVTVGSGGTAYSSTNVWGTVSSESPSIRLPASTSGTDSVVRRHNPSGLIEWPVIAKAGGGYASSVVFNSPENPFVVFYNFGSSDTISSNIGSSSYNMGDSPTVPGGTSVYNGYGAGGSAGFSGNTQTGSPWANNGGNGYVKVTIAD